MSDIRDFTGKNRRFTGTDSIKLPVGTTAQRNSSPTAGDIRFNSTINLSEYYDGTDWKAIDSPPTVTQISIAGRANGTTGFIDRTGVGDSTVETIVVSGSLFDTTGATVTFEGTQGSAGTVTTQSITRNSSSQLTVTVTSADFLEADDPYTVKVTNGSGLSGVLAEAIDVNVPPAFATNADTNIGTVQDNQSDFSGLTTVAATDADGDTITHTISAGSLPNGMSLATNGTFSGTASSLPSSSTDYTFTVQAATDKGTTSRQFVVTAIDSLYPSATGGTITTSGNFKIHTFNSSSNFVVSKTGVSPNNVVRYLVVGGGGGGGTSQSNNEGNHTSGGGGGAGGMRFNNTEDFTITAQTYGITVGGGGSGGSGSNTRANNGSASSFSNISSAGGGYGGDSHNTQNGSPGGSGGGGGCDFDTPPTVGSAGSGNSPSTSPSQGNPGGAGRSDQQSGGGGGAGQSGQPGDNTNAGVGGDGGNGSSNDITGSSVTYAGGGGGGTYSNDASNQGSGGSGGGGQAGKGGQPGTANLGGGGGGTSQADGSSYTAGSGGSGVVIIRYRYQ